MAVVRLHVMHSSMEFRDTAAQKRQDVNDLFARAVKRDVSWITGTEAGEAELWKIIVAEAKQRGFKLHHWRDCWIAVRTLKITTGTWAKGDVLVADNDETWGRGHDTGFPWVTFVHTQVGPVAVAAGHYPVRGARPGDPNYRITVRFASKLAEWGRRYGAGARKAFYGGDQNISDRTLDTFRGKPFTSAWDELGKWENTGHGNIDVIASYDPDKGVKAVYCRALSDKEFPQHSDHFPVEAGFDVRV